MLKLLHRHVHVYNEIFVRIKTDQHERRSCILHKTAGKRRQFVQQQTNKRQPLDEISTAIRSFMEKIKQNHRKSPKFRLTLRLFRAGKQRNRNKATHLKTVSGSVVNVLTARERIFQVSQEKVEVYKHQLINSTINQLINSTRLTNPRSNHTDISNGCSTRDSAVSKTPAIGKWDVL